ncbi:MAG TPA: hypothetical protein VFA51_14760 [Candidatus Udaeobacter sp.]|nr:hypothetical protein [Candidatus Udaeobacter sp.]
MCYIHIGPHKKGTTSIQAFLKENRSRLLKDGYFVPETRNVYGGHHVACQAALRAARARSSSADGIVVCGRNQECYMRRDCYFVGNFG